MRLALPCNWEERTGGGPDPPATLRFGANEPLGWRAIRKMASGAAMHLSEANGAWSGRPDLNRRPQRPERCALTSCATPRRKRLYVPLPASARRYPGMQGVLAPVGTIICMAGRRSARLAYPASPRKVARPKHYLVVIALCTVGVLAVTASASILAALLTQSTSKRVLFNVFSWEGFGLDLQFRQLHEAEALDVARSALLAEKRISDHPVLVRGEGPGFEFGSELKLRSNTSSIEDACGVYPDGEAAPENVKKIGPCYLIYLAEPGTYQTQLAMTMALSSQSPTRRRVEVTDVGAFRTAWSTATLPFNGLVEHFDPIWSPDGKWLLYTVWEDGQVWFTLMDPIARTTRRLLPLEGYMNTRPLWSPDSRWVAYASPKEIRVYDTKTGVERKLLPSAMSQSDFNGLHLAFQDGRLAILLETQVNLWEYAYDVTRDEFRQVRTGGTRPRWAEDTWRENPVLIHASLRPIPSPTGRYMAQIRLVNGRRVLEVNPRQ